MPLLLLAFTALMLTPLAQSSPPSTEVKAFAKTPDAFEMPIEAAGLASLPEVRLDADSGELFVAYRYAAGDAQRAGGMTLLPDPGDANRYRGRWRTVEELYLDFDSDGTARGEYTFNGSDYAIGIRRRP